MGFTRGKTGSGSFEFELITITLEEATFRTYLNYLVAWARYIEEEYPEKIDLVKAVVNLRGFKRIKGNKNFDSEKLFKLLRNAWFTEIQLHLTGGDAEFMRYSNHWAPVQAYYAVFLELSALFVASNNVNGKRSHATILHTIGSWARDRNIFVRPWSLCIKGYSKNWKYLNFPHQPAQISPLSSAHRGAPLDFTAMLLRTTRERQLERKRTEWLQSHPNRKRLSPGQRQKWGKDLAPTTLFDALYRLRIRSNYEDADAVLMGTEDFYDAEEFAKSLKQVVFNTLLSLELLIIRYIGMPTFESAMKSFSPRVNKEYLCETILMRDKIIRKVTL